MQVVELSCGDLKIMEETTANIGKIVELLGVRHQRMLIKVYTYTFL
jgi:hypothetical protein